jgi:hypothetical protein
MYSPTAGLKAEYINTLCIRDCPSHAAVTGNKQVCLYSSHFWLQDANKRHTL